MIYGKLNNKGNKKYIPNLIYLLEINIRLIITKVPELYISITKRIKIFL